MIPDKIDFWEIYCKGICTYKKVQHWVTRYKFTGEQILMQIEKGGYVKRK